MNVGYIFLFVTLITFIALTKEIPIEGSTFPPEPDVSSITVEEGKSDDVKFVPHLDRSNRSRMLTLTTTFDYDEWWFYTTRRPPPSFKDFPGRPGVATWREISPGGSSEEKRKSRKMSSPTAAGVSSGSQSSPSKYHYSQVMWVLLTLLCFCWT